VLPEVVDAGERGRTHTRMNPQWFIAVGVFAVGHPSYKDDEQACNCNVSLDLSSIFIFRQILEATLFYHFSLWKMLLYRTHSGLAI